MNKNYTKILCFFALLVGFCFPQVVSAGNDGRARNRERMADRRFLRQKFDRAMALYDEAAESAVSVSLAVELHAKAGRLNFMLRHYDAAAMHFEYTERLDAGQLTDGDICDWVDALRFGGASRCAEEVCLRYAYRDAGSRSQRFLNMAGAFGIVMPDDETCAVAAATVTSGAEYWVGKGPDGTLFAESDNAFNDPRKRFYYDTYYRSVQASDQRSGTLPAGGELRNGPLAFSADGNFVVGTEIVDQKSKKILLENGRIQPFATKLLMSRRMSNGRWSSPLPVFGQEENGSCCHPFLALDDRVLLFASDAPGGYGGYDIYMAFWDDHTQMWGTPVNVGPEINTEGDEIFPTCADGRICFASNGQVGYGGYDLYACECDLESGMPVPGTLRQFPAPFNSVYNDFCLFAVDAHWGYFISDRNLETGDDMYVYRIQDPGDTSGERPFFGMSEQNALLGGQALLAGVQEPSSVRRTERVPFPAYAPRRQVLSVFFDFDSAVLSDESVEALRYFVSGTRDYSISNFRILGYADEMGTEEYNYNLSARRGEAVAEYLRDAFSVPAEVTACGRIVLSEERPSGIPVVSSYPYEYPVDSATWISPMEDFSERIRRNQPARRADIYINY